MPEFEASFTVSIQFYADSTHEAKLYAKDIKSGIRVGTSNPVYFSDTRVSECHDSEGTASGLPNNLENC